MAKAIPKSFWLGLLLTICSVMDAQQPLIWRNPYPQANALTGVDFIDARNGVAVGLRGTILWTADGGATWTHAGQESLADLQDVDLVDELTGYATGDSGTVLKTTDGGRTWFLLPYATKEILLRMHFLSADTGVIAGNGRVILKTRDGGRTWSKDSTYHGSMYGISFMDSREGYIVGAIGDRFLATWDGGDTWNEIPYNGPTLRAVSRRTAVGHYGGSIELPNGTFGTGRIGFANLTSIRYRDSLLGCAVGDSSINLTWDGGRTWKTGTLPTRTFLSDGRMLDSLNVVAVGEAGVITRSRDGGESWEYAPEETRQDIHAMQSLGGDTLVAMMDRYLNKTTDGWKSWSRLTIPESRSLYSFHFATSQIGFALAESLYTTRDGGNTWIGTAWNFGSHISYIPQNTHFLGDGGTGIVTAYNQYAQRIMIFRTVNSGQAWDSVLAFQSGFTSARLQFAAPGVGYLYAGTRDIYRTSDAGASWTKLPVPMNGNCAEFHFPTQETGFLACTERSLPAILKTADGGISWKRHAIPALPDERISSIHFTSDKVGFLTLNEINMFSWGRILMTRDGGETWFQPHAGRTPRLNVIHSTPTGKVFAGGQFGALVEIPASLGPAHVRRARSDSDHGGFPCHSKLRRVGGSILTPEVRNTLGRRIPSPGN